MTENIKDEQSNEHISCPFCDHVALLKLYSNDRSRVVNYLWNVLLNDLYEMVARGSEDEMEILALDRRVRNLIIKYMREEVFMNKIKEDKE